MKYYASIKIAIECYNLFSAVTVVLLVVNKLRGVNTEKKYWASTTKFMTLKIMKILISDLIKILFPMYCRMRE